MQLPDKRARISMYKTFYHSITCVIDSLLMALDQCLNTQSTQHLQPQTHLFDTLNSPLSLSLSVLLLSVQELASTYFVNKLDALSSLFIFYKAQHYHDAHMSTLHYQMSFPLFWYGNIHERKKLCVPFSKWHLLYCCHKIFMSLAWWHRFNCSLYERWWKRVGRISWGGLSKFQVSGESTDRLWKSYRTKLTQKKIHEKSKD